MCKTKPMNLICSLWHAGRAAFAVAFGATLLTASIAAPFEAWVQGAQVEVGRLALV